MNEPNGCDPRNHDQLIAFLQLAGIGLMTFLALLVLALVLPGAA